jgi:hypothetical protein
LTTLSPELVLVSPPDEAGLARLALPAYPPFAPVRAVPPRRNRIRFDRGFATFCFVCVSATMAPFALAVVFGRR